MGDEVFDGQSLAEKLSKLNSSQQSIESLSRWCISHRKKAKLVVETWDKLFNSAQREQRVSFLYLANDILQNSRRKGSEFVNEFWKVLPAALKHVYENGDEHGKKAACRLVDIWEERKVFGSRGQNLKDEMLGKNPPALPASNGKSSNHIKIVKRDAHSLRIKLAVGGVPEKIVSAFQSIYDENNNEEAALSKCEAAVHHIGKLESEIDSSDIQGNQQGSALLDEINEQENVLQQCLMQLESAEATRAALVSQLKEALQDQESNLDHIRSQLQVTRAHIEQAGSMRQRLTSLPIHGIPTTTNNLLTEGAKAGEPNLPLVQQPNSTPPPLPPLSQPMLSFANLKPTEEESKKAAAAAVAAKLAASTSSAQMLTSVLSSLVAEEAASMNGGGKPPGFSSALHMFSPPEKRPKLDNSISVSDVNTSDLSNSAYFTSLQKPLLNNVPLAPPTNMQSISQANQLQAPYAPPPPPLPMPQSNSSANQFAQSAGLMVGVMPYGYSTSSLPPPPPLPSHIVMGLARPSPQQQSQPQQPQSQQPQQQTTNGGGYYRPPGIGFFGQSPQPTTPPVPRQ